MQGLSFLLLNLGSSLEKGLCAWSQKIIMSYPCFARLSCNLLQPKLWRMISSCLLMGLLGLKLCPLPSLSTLQLQGQIQELPLRCVGSNTVFSNEKAQAASAVKVPFVQLRRTSARSLAPWQITCADAEAFGVLTNSVVTSRRSSQTSSSDLNGASRLHLHVVVQFATETKRHAAFFTCISGAHSKGE